MLFLVLDFFDQCGVWGKKSNSLLDQYFGQFFDRFTAKMGDHQMAVADRAGSPNKVRIGQLSGKLQSLQDELEHEKQVICLVTISLHHLTARSDAVELKVLHEW